MNNLNEKNQKRLDDWRKKVSGASQPEKARTQVSGTFRRPSKHDYGDVVTAEEWDEEIRKSQFRR